MGRCLKWFLIGVFATLTLITIAIPSQAADDLREDQTWWMVNGEHHQIEGFFFKDESILGFCSNNCYAIDLALYATKTHKQIDQSEAMSASPELTVPYDGSFTVEVRMRNCARRGGCRTWLEIGNEG